MRIIKKRIIFAAKTMKRLQIKDEAGIKEMIRLYFAGNDESKFIHRLHAILLFMGKEEESCDSIGYLLGHSPRTISNWIRRINATGDIESLRSKKQYGRPSRLSGAQRQEVKRALEESPQKHGIPRNSWDGKSLSSYITGRYGIVLKTRTCQHLSQQLECQGKRGRPSVRQSGKAKKVTSDKPCKTAGNDRRD